MLAPEFFPVYGGAGNYVLQIAKQMPSDVEMYIVAPRRHDSIGGGKEGSSSLDAIVPPSAHVTYLGDAKDVFFYNFSFQFNCAKHIPSMIDSLGIDIVHSQSAMPDYFLSPKKLGIPTVTTIHTTVEGHIEALKASRTPFGQLRRSEKFSLILGPLLKAMEDRYYTDIRMYISVSEWAKRQASREKGINPSRIRVIRPGIDSEVFNPSRKEEASAFYGRLAGIKMPKVLFLSRMATRKGIHLLLRAIPKVLAKVDAHFIFAGEGTRPDFDIPAESYTYLGHVPRDHPAYLYSLSDIYILPSLYENFPVAIHEAMASGCAVVSTNICGIPEMIRNDVNGLLIPPNSVDAIAEALIRLVENDTLRGSLGRTARSDVVKEYSWKKTAIEIRELYLSLKG